MPALLEIGLIPIKDRSAGAAYPGSTRPSRERRPMIRLTLLLHALVATVLAGVGLIAVLVSGYVTGAAIIGAILTGFLLGFPVAWLIAKKLYQQ